MTSLLCLDFETVDPYIGLNLGPGWVYEHHLKQGKFKVIGWSDCCINDDNTITESIYYHDIEYDKAYLFKRLDRADGIIMHNAPYDIGCLIVLGYPLEKIKKLQIYDTKIMAKLYDNQRSSYSLDDLSKDFLPVEMQKKKSALADIVQKHELLRTKSNKPRKPGTSTYIRDAMAYAYTHMDILQEKEPDLMAYYANQDTIATAHVYLVLSKKLNNDKLSAYYSYLTFICNVALRIKGVRVSVPAIQHAIKVLEPVVKGYASKLITLLKVPVDFNLESPELAEIIGGLGYPLPLTPGGKWSLTSAWIESYEGSDELLKTIKLYRGTKKLLRDFAYTILTNLKHTCPNALQGQEWGYVYPELNVLGAKTGRMSSSAPNIQQIPNPERSEHSNLIRKIYIADPGKTWVSADWSNQEGRWQVHYGLPFGSAGLVDAFKIDPDLDLHSDIAEILFEYKKEDIDPKAHKARRKITKGINLGISYGMGNPKLSEQLGKTLLETISLRELYNTKLPFLSTLGKAIETKLKQKQYIKFFDGRVFRRESAMIGNKRVYFDYKGINALMQGSGASQMYRAIYECYLAGLDILFPVHDEINIQVPISLHEDDDIVPILQRIMENTTDINCRVPMPVKIQTGPSWGELE